MTVQAFFHLDCNAVIPDCRYKCTECIQELIAVVGSLEGISRVSTERRGEASRIVVQYDPDVVGIDRVMETCRQLPSFYKGRFEPKVLVDHQDQ